ncbi:hypothetical protein MASR1M31_15750 [Porphyromonadaceae bacterium]
MIEEVVLKYDEYEVIRLLDYEGMLQEEAAEKMNITPNVDSNLRKRSEDNCQSFCGGKDDCD